MRYSSAVRVRAGRRVSKLQPGNEVSVGGAWLADLGKCNSAFARDCEVDVLAREELRDRLLLLVLLLLGIRLLVLGPPLSLLLLLWEEATHTSGFTDYRARAASRFGGQFFFLGVWFGERSLPPCTPLRCF